MTTTGPMTRTRAWIVIPTITTTATMKTTGIMTTTRAKITTGITKRH